MYFSAIRVTIIKNTVGLIPKLRKPFAMSLVTKATNEITESINKANNTQLGSRLIWVDCEMTGLDYNVNKICEIACIVTEADLTVVDELEPIIIEISNEDLKQMSKWCCKTFKKNGLYEKIKASKITIDEAEDQVLEFLQRHTEKFSCALAGNSVHQDRAFIDRQMPRVAAHLHYRTVDVTSFKELIRRWYPDHSKHVPEKAMNHRSLDDIRESIQELKWHREIFFKSVKELSKVDELAKRAEEFGKPIEPKEAEKDWQEVLAEQMAADESEKEAKDELPKDGDQVPEAKKLKSTCDRS